MTIARLTAQVLILSLCHSTLASGEQAAASAGTANKERIELFGVGAELKVKREGRSGLRGVVDSIGPGSFVIVPNGSSSPEEIAFGDVRSINYPKRGYKAEGNPDPVAARRMVVQLGVGEHIMVKVSPKRTVRGHIRAIHGDRFEIQPDGQPAALAVSYDSVWQVHKNLSLGATVVILLAIVATAVLILVLTGNEEIDVLPQ